MAVGLVGLVGRVGLAGAGTADTGVDADAAGLSSLLCVWESHVPELWALCHIRCQSPGLHTLFL